MGQGITEIKAVSMNKEEWTLQDEIVYPWSIQNIKKKNPEN